MRKVFGALFLLVTVVTVLVQANLLAAEERLGLMVHLALAMFAVASVICAIYLFRSRESWEAGLICPYCHQPRLTPAVIGQPHPNVLALILGGIVLAVIMQQSQTRRFHCAACNKESNLRTVGSCVAVAWCLAYLLLLIATAMTSRQGMRGM
jgi:hypothetical protein